MPEGIGRCNGHVAVITLCENGVGLSKDCLNNSDICHLTQIIEQGGASGNALLL